jgi:hypothetical protein
VTVFDDACAKLTEIKGVLDRLEKTRVSLGSYAAGLRLLANVVGVFGDELRAQRARATALENDFGDHLLQHEKDYPSAAEQREWLAFAREQRKREVPDID